tara:strand:+ start:59797 stop:60621 length:825 start_codon:yes stop_codon:yes gene_type:complete
MAAISDVSLLLVGGGKMGGALLNGWLSNGLQPENVVLVDKNSEILSSFSDIGISTVLSPLKIDPDFSADIIFFAVKPDLVVEVSNSYKKFISNGALLISVAAGVKISALEVHSGSVPIIRAMPNTPSSIGRGITAVCANNKVISLQKEICEELFRAVGDVIWISEESHMDAVTAVSGSGPAYLFLMIECLSEAGISIGLDPDISYKLALETIAGSSELARNDSEPPNILRENVTSPGGTTEAALDILMSENGLKYLLDKAVKAAYQRSKDLAGR